MAMETLPSGTTLHGRYRIERALGSGGFGHVYLAVDLQTNQQYALKEYLVTGAGGKAQLEHESRVLSHLHHPSLPAFQEAFDERGRFYVVLSYIKGSDLTDFIRNVRQRNEVIPLKRCMEWLLSVSDAVTFLHSQQPPIIHRDIKPDNIRITPEETAILVDLGNAKAAADGARTLIFIRHQGTPGYAPLEQYPGGSGTDARSDVYALGATLYFALTAHEPPSVSTRSQAIQQGLPDLPSLQEHVANNPPVDTPEAQANRQFRLGVSKPARPTPRHSRHLAQLATLPPELLDRLNRIIKRAMAMKPKERYQSVADFSRDLQSVLTAMPSPLTPSARPVDPHSTQPELPPLLESMQEAREKANQGTPPAQSPQSASSPVPPLLCPRCHYELTVKASFCPKCGTSLTNGSQQNQAILPPATNLDLPSSHNQSSSQGGPVDKTSIHSPRPPIKPASTTSAPVATPAPTTLPHAQNMTHPPSAHLPTQSRGATAPRVPPRSFLETGSRAVVTPQKPQTQVATISTPPAQPVQPIPQQPAQVAQSASTRKSLDTLTIVAILLAVILLVIIILVFALHGHFRVLHDLPISIRYATIQAQKLAHERTILL